MSPILTLTELISVMKQYLFHYFVSYRTSSSVVLSAEEDVFCLVFTLPPLLPRGLVLPSHLHILSAFWIVEAFAVDNLWVASQSFVWLFGSPNTSISNSTY